MEARGKIVRPLAERLWEKVEFNGPIPECRPDLGQCWIWLGCTTPDGYGNIGRPGTSGKIMGAHRAAYELTIGPIPPGKQLDHLCRTRNCVRPSHLEVVDNRTNVLRGTGPSAINAAKSSCPKGHPFDDANTYYQPRSDRALPRRVCRICDNEKQRKRYAANILKGKKRDYSGRKLKSRN